MSDERPFPLRVREQLDAAAAEAAQGGMTEAGFLMMAQAAYASANGASRFGRVHLVSVPAAAVKRMGRKRPPDGAQ